MVTNITGFQQARRREAEKLKAVLEKKAEKVKEVKSNDSELLSEEEVKAKLVELGVSFHPNAKLKTLQEKLKAAEANG